jgi:hypothetical protein
MRCDACPCHQALDALCRAPFVNCALCGKRGACAFALSQSAVACLTYRSHCVHSAIARTAHCAPLMATLCPSHRCCWPTADQGGGGLFAVVLATSSHVLDTSVGVQDVVATGNVVPSTRPCTAIAPVASALPLRNEPASPQLRPCPRSCPHVFHGLQSWACMRVV